MQRRDFLLAAAAAATFPQLTRARTMTTSIFRDADPEGLVHDTVHLMRQMARDADALNAEMLGLILRDPLAMFVVQGALSPPTQVFEAEARARAATGWLEAAFGPLSADDRAHVAALATHAAAQQIDSYAFCDRLGREMSALDPDLFFDQIAQVSARLPAQPAAAPETRFDAIGIVTQALSMLLGHALRPRLSGAGGTPETRAPLLFDPTLAPVIARRFEATALEDVTAFSWLYVPNFEAFLATGPLPAQLPSEVAALSPRLARTYARLNAHQAQRFERDAEANELP